MFEFFIALFGGLFYGGKHVNYKSKVKQVKHSEELHNEISCSYEYLTNTKKWFLDDRCGILNSISDDLQEVFGKQWRELFCDTVVFGTIPNTGMVNRYANQWEIALNIYISKKGYVPPYTIAGYSLMNVQDTQRSRIIKMCEIIERNINNLRTTQSKQPLKIFFVPNDVGNRISSKLSDGTLMWRHTIIGDDTLTRTLW